jgi:hypothetical protein
MSRNGQPLVVANGRRVLVSSLNSAFHNQLGRVQVVLDDLVEVAVDGYPYPVAFGAAELAAPPLALRERHDALMAARWCHAASDTAWSLWAVRRLLDQEYGG